MLEKCKTPLSQRVLLSLSKQCTMQGYSERSHLSPRTYVYEHATRTDFLQTCVTGPSLQAYLPSGLKGQTAWAERRRKNLCWACTDQAAKQEMTCMHPRSSCKEQASALANKLLVGFHAMWYEHVSAEGLGCFFFLPIFWHSTSKLIKHLLHKSMLLGEERLFP